MQLAWPPSVAPRSPIYADLRTNLPREIMGFSREEPFPPGPSFCGWREVLAYPPSRGGGARHSRPSVQGKEKSPHVESPRAPGTGDCQEA